MALFLIPNEIQESVDESQKDLGFFSGWQLQRLAASAVVIFSYLTILALDFIIDRVLARLTAA